MVIIGPTQRCNERMSIVSNGDVEIICYKRKDNESMVSGRMDDSGRMDCL